MTSRSGRWCRGYSGGGRLDVWVYPTRDAPLTAGADLAMQAGLDEDPQAVESFAARPLRLRPTRVGPIDGLSHQSDRRSPGRSRALDVDQASIVLEGVLHTFRGRLDVKDSLRFADALRALYVHDWDIEKDRKPFAPPLELARGATGTTRRRTRQCRMWRGRSASS